MLEALSGNVKVVWVFFIVLISSVNCCWKELFVAQNLMFFSKFVKSFSNFVISLILGE